MSGMSESLFMLATGLLAGLIGSILGVGGGVVIVPFLTIFGGIDIKVSIAVSLASIIATSLVSSSVYFGEKLAKPRVALLLVPSIILGAYTGANITVYAPASVIEVVFALLLFYTAFHMYRKNLRRSATDKQSHARLEGSRGGSGGMRWYVKTSLLTYVAGITSGMLGVGGGTLLVPILNLVVGLSLKESIATSLLVIGGAASAGAVIYILEGLTVPHMVALLLVGIMFGASLGSRVMLAARTSLLLKLFIVFILYSGFRILLRGLGVW